MKTNGTLALTVAIALSCGLGALPGHAQELSKAFVSLVCISSNQSGGLVYRSIGNRDFIRQCAREQGITNLSGLSLVFNRTSNSLEVVRGTNHDLVCTPLSFSGGVSLGKSNHSRVERLEFVYVGSDTMADGTLAATERYVFGRSNQLTGFSLTGRLQYAVSGSSSNRTAIYTGSLIAGPRFLFRHHSDDDQGEDNDDQGRDRREGDRSSSRSDDDRQ